MYPIMRPGLSQDVAIGVASAASTAFGLTTVVRLVATVACYVAFGAAPTAAKAGSGSARLAPNWPEYFLVQPGEKVAVIQDSTTGTLSITEMTR